MKKIVTILLLITSIAITSQEKTIITIGFDPTLAIKGAYKYNNTPVLDVYLTAITQTNNKNEVGVIIEYAHLNPKYFDMGFLYNRKIPIFKPNIETLLGAEITLLNRQFDGYETQKLFFTYGLNATTRFYLNKSFSINLRCNIKYRTDLKNHYNIENPVKLNGYIGVSYIINRTPRKRY